MSEGDGFEDFASDIDQIKLDGVEITKTFEIVDGKGKFTQASRGDYTLEIPYGTTTVANDCCVVFQSNLLRQAVTKLVLPDTVTAIEDGDGSSNSGAFIGILNEQLREIVLSKNLITIGNGAFKYFPANGKSIIIPRSVREVHIGAFEGPSYASYHFENVYYEGTQEEWNSIAIGGANSILTNATHIYFNYQPE